MVPENPPPPGHSSSPHGDSPSARVLATDAVLDDLVGDVKDMLLLDDAATTGDSVMELSESDVPSDSSDAPMFGSSAKKVSPGRYGSTPGSEGTSPVVGFLGTSATGSSSPLRSEPGSSPLRAAGDLFAAAGAAVLEGSVDDGSPGGTAPFQNGSPRSSGLFEASPSLTPSSPAKAVGSPLKSDRGARHSETVLSAENSPDGFLGGVRGKLAVAPSVEEVTLKGSPLKKLNVSKSDVRILSVEDSTTTQVLEHLWQDRQPDSTSGRGPPSGRSGDLLEPSEIHQASVFLGEDNSVVLDDRGVPILAQQVTEARDHGGGTGEAGVSAHLFRTRFTHSSIHSSRVRRVAGGGRCSWNKTSVNH